MRRVKLKTDVQAEGGKIIPAGTTVTAQVGSAWARNPAPDILRVQSDDGLVGRTPETNTDPAD